MAIYDKPTRALMTDWARETLKAGEVFSKQQAIDWFQSNYPKIRSTTVGAHVSGMSVNTPRRSINNPQIKPGAGYDLFYRVGRNQFRLWDPDRDPAPLYDDPVESFATKKVADFNDDDAHESETPEAGDTFALEKDLQNFLVRNLGRLESGLKLYEDEGFSGVEYNAGGGRRIDILAVDSMGAFVVIELKVSRGYEKVTGQILRYMAWVQENLADDKTVRGIIVASEITEDLILATSLIADRVKLFEYSISFSINQRER